MGPPSDREPHRVPHQTAQPPPPLRNFRRRMERPSFNATKTIDSPFNKAVLPLYLLTHKSQTQNLTEIRKQKRTRGFQCDANRPLISTSTLSSIANHRDRLEGLQNGPATTKPEANPNANKNAGMFKRDANLPRISTSKDTRAHTGTSNDRDRQQGLPKQLPSPNGTHKQPCINGKGSP